MKATLFRWRANFITGLAIVLPAIISMAVVRWLFGTVSYVTDLLLIFVPSAWTHEQAGLGPLRWYWSIIALIWAVVLVSLIGRSARYYIGEQMIQLFDSLLLRIPLLNKIYGAIKQVNQAFTSTKKTAFQQVVLIEFPRAGMYSIGFVTGKPRLGPGVKTDPTLVSVFIPTTPMPTNGFLVMVSEKELVRLDMSVADGIKSIISLGAINPEPEINHG